MASINPTVDPQGSASDSTVASTFQSGSQSQLVPPKESDTVAIAKYIADAEERLSDIINKQFRRMTIATLLPLLILFAALFLLPRFARTPAQTDLLAELRTTNAQLAQMTQSLLSSTTTEIDSEVVDAVVRQAALHEQAIVELNQALQEPTAESQSLIQVIGSAAILALLGALGIQRLQNIDTEINSVRTSVFEQAEARAKAIQESVNSQIIAQVQQQFLTAREQVEQVVENVSKTRDEFQAQSHSMLEQFRGEVNSLEAEMKGVRSLFEEYPWLREESQYKQATAIKHLFSVGQAQDLAETFRRADDNVSARQALWTIIENDLPGSSNDFHNASTEAMRLNDPTLALSIVDLGLKNNPDQYDLVADKTNILARSGRAGEAREFFEDWRARKPNEITRSWRPVVFYEDLFDSLELDQAAIVSLETAFDEVTAKLPYEVKPWSEYADLMAKQGNIERAEEIIGRGLRHNPFSQQLNYVLGELLLKRGEVDKATPHLEQALRTDYQASYQHDVNQHAVRATLAQAYEAAGRYEEANRLYKSIVMAVPRPIPQLIEYANDRLAAIGLVQGTDSQPSPQDIAQFMRIIQALQSNGEEAHSLEDNEDQK